jgi:hypothetical protein
LGHARRAVLCRQGNADRVAGPGAAEEIHTGLF